MSTNRNLTALSKTSASLHAMPRVSRIKKAPDLRTHAQLERDVEKSIIPDNLLRSKRSKSKSDLASSQDLDQSTMSKSLYKDLNSTLQDSITQSPFSLIKAPASWSDLVELNKTILLDNRAVVKCKRYPVMIKLRANEKEIVSRIYTPSFILGALNLNNIFLANLVSNNIDFKTEFQNLEFILHNLVELLTSNSEFIEDMNLDKKTKSRLNANGLLKCKKFDNLKNCVNETAVKKAFKTMSIESTSSSSELCNRYGIAFTVYGPYDNTKQLHYVQYFNNIQTMENALRIDRASEIYNFMQRNRLDFNASVVFFYCAYPTLVLPATINLSELVDVNINDKNNAQYCNLCIGTGD